MSPNDADGMANSVDPDQAAPLGAVWSGSALFAQAYLSENLGSLRYLLQSCHRFWFIVVFYRIKETQGLLENKQAAPNPSWTLHDVDKRDF